MADEIQNADAPTDVCPKPDDAPPILPPVARFERADWLGFAATTIVALSVYLFTLAPNVTLEFSGILSTAAMSAGVPHPPGYPVWTIYSWLVTKLLPFSNIAWRVAAGSAVASALACGLVAMMVSHGGRMLFDGMPAFSQLKPREQNWLCGVCGYVAGLVLAFSGTVWDQAVIVEIRGLSLLLFVGALCLFMRWFFEPGRQRFLYGVFFLFGILLTNSQELIVALPGLVCAVMLGDARTGRDVSLFVMPLAALATIRNQYNLIWTVLFEEMNWPMLAMSVAVVLTGVAFAIKTRRAGTEWKAALACGSCLLVGLGSYFYLPVASMTTPPVNWGYSRTVEGFFHMMSRGQYQQVLPTDNLFSYVKQLWVLLLVLGKTFGWMYLMLAVLPLLCVRRFDPAGRRWMLGLLAIFLCVGLLLVAMLNPNPDRSSLEMLEPYFGPACVILAVWLGLGLMLLAAKMTKPAGNASG